MLLDIKCQDAMDTKPDLAALPSLPSNSQVYLYPRRSSQTPSIPVSRLANPRHSTYDPSRNASRLDGLKQAFVSSALCARKLRENEVTQGAQWHDKDGPSCPPLSPCSSESTTSEASSLAELSTRVQMLGPRIARREEAHDGARRVSVTRYYVDAEEMEGRDGERYKVYRRVAVVQSNSPRQRPYTVPLRTLRRPSMAGLHLEQELARHNNPALPSLSSLFPMGVPHPPLLHSNLFASFDSSKPSRQPLKVPSSRTSAPHRRAAGLEQSRMAVMEYEDSSERAVVGAEGKREWTGDEFGELCKRRGKVVMPLRFA